MDWLKFFLSLYMVLLVLGMAATAYQVGRPREPISPVTGCLLVTQGSLILIMLLLVWQRL